MAYINVAAWTCEQVTDWLKGLDDSMYNYVYSFTNNEVGGQQLLNIRPYELVMLGMTSIGHQEIVLEAVEILRNFHYHLDKENLQFMALHVATAAHCLHRNLACDASKIETRLLSDIFDVIATIKPLVFWLERAPFRGQIQFAEICRNMLRLGLEMATIAQRDRFVERPAEQIKSTAEKLERLANYIIQDITDPMLLQPASLNLVTLKKRESDLGFKIEASRHGVHRVTDIKYNSPAHNSGKIEDGDEIVQINYQTVVGWQYKTVLLQLRESLPDVVLTLKKRPKHTKMYGQIYMQPYRLPSKKRVMGARWGENIPSPRVNRTRLAVPDGAFNLPLPPLKDEEKATAVSSDTDSSNSDMSTSTDAKANEKELRLYYPKPRAMLQRRNTICGDEYLGLKSFGGVPEWHVRKSGANGDPSSPSLRDKSASFGFGLEIRPRPNTCIAAGMSKFSGNDVGKFGLFDDTSRPLAEALPQSHVKEAKGAKSKPGVSKVVRFDANMRYDNYVLDEKFTCNVENTILETFEPIPFADEDEDDDIETLRNTSDKAEEILEALDKVSRHKNAALVEAVNVTTVSVARRGRLDKSHSTPAYDNSGEEVDTPPAIEPRKEFLLLTPPVPPPRPRKQKDLMPWAVPPPPPPPPKPLSLKVNTNTNIPTESGKATENKWTELASSSNSVAPPTYLALTTMSGTADLTVDASELHTPIKVRTLTLKKKHSLIAKRRNVNLKLLGTGDIQGHLFRRTKSRRGVTFWARMYFIMQCTNLYGFLSKDATKASCVIFLPGFTVSLAKEVHSKPFAFKVYHSAKTFYFAAESQNALTQWIEFIRQSAMQPQRFDCCEGDINTKDLFSETESSSEECESVVTQNLCTPSPQAQNAKDVPSSLSLACKSGGTPSTAAKQDRRYLGSLRKLTRASLAFKSSTSEKKTSSDIPVPTEQYRSYRKVPGGSFGIQIGANTPGYHLATPNAEVESLLHPQSAYAGRNCFPQIVPDHAAAVCQRKLSLSSSRGSIVSNTESASMFLGPPSTPAPLPSGKVNQLESSISIDSPSKGMKNISYNFIHASNPNLVEFDFQTSKTLDYSLPKINPSWDAHQNIQVQGFVTLKDLMLRKQEEEAQQPYNNRVLLGVEKKDERKRNAQRSNDWKHVEGGGAEQQANGSKISKTQNRSLPKTPDYEISFKPDDEDIKRTRTKEGLKLRDFGYELISGDEPIGEVATSARPSITSASAKSRQFLRGKKTSTHSISSNSSTDFSISASGGGGVSSSGKLTGSFKKRSKLEAVKSSSERIFQFNKHSAGSSTGMSMTLPLNNKKFNYTTEGACAGGSCGSIKKSQTYNNDLKEQAGAKYEAQRKNSAPMPNFTKFSFSSVPSGNCSYNNSGANKATKEKKLLGSPLLHRTIYGSSSHHSSSTASAICMGREYDQEIFSQIVFPKVSSHHGENGAGRLRNASLLSTGVSTTELTAPETVAPPPPTCNAVPPHDSSNAATPEYPNMECPPVFEPEIYSLTDSNASLTLLRRNNSNSNAGTEEKH